MTIADWTTDIATWVAGTVAVLMWIDSKRAPKIAALPTSGSTQAIQAKPRARWRAWMLPAYFVLTVLFKAFEIYSFYVAPGQPTRSQIAHLVEAYVEILFVVDVFGFILIVNNMVFKPTSWTERSN